VRLDIAQFVYLSVHRKAVRIFGFLQGYFLAFR
jgi:hypothetical protein